MEKRGEQLDKAKKKLAKQKPPKKSGPVKKAGRAAGATVHGYVHGKLYEVEHENVGTESAHRSELVGEAALRSTSRYVKKQIREHPAKAVQKAESRHIKATADYQYRATVEAHPEMQKGGAVSRYILYSLPMLFSCLLYWEHTNLSQSAGFGEAPQQAFLQPPRDAKIASVATLALLAICALLSK